MSCQCEDLPVDALLGALADRRRRFVVRYMRETADGVASCEELAEYVDSRTSDGKSTEMVTTRLHHVDLPKLADAQLLEYDPRSKTARYRPPSDVEALVDAVVEIAADGVD